MTCAVPNFLDVVKYPEIVFRSHRIERKDSRYLLIGDLWMHGMNREVRIPFTYNGKIKDLAGNIRIAIEGGLIIDRRDWGITYGKVLDNGGLVAGNEVKIGLDVEAVKK